jgi:hypothetical protein
MADIYYYGTVADDTRLNHHSGLANSYVSAVPGSGYASQGWHLGNYTNAAFWGATVFIDGSAAGATSNNLSAVDVAWVKGAGYSETHHIVDR